MVRRKTFDRGLDTRTECYLRLAPVVYEFKYGRKAMIGPLPDLIYRIEEIKYFDRSEGERQARVWDEWRATHKEAARTLLAYVAG